MTSGYVSELFVSFQGEGTHVGRRHLFVRLAGCNLRCRYCDTPDSLVRTQICTIFRDGEEEQLVNPIDARTLRGIIDTWLSADPLIDAVALTGGEPLMQAEYLAEVLGGERMAVPALLETNGMLPAQLTKVSERVAIVSMDIKPPSNTGEAEFWRQHRDFLDGARDKDLYVKVVVDEGTALTEVERAAKLVAERAPGAPLYLQPMTGDDGTIKISTAHLTALYLGARACHASVRVLPQTHKMMKIQ